MREQVVRNALAAQAENTALAFLVFPLTVKLGIDLDSILPEILEHGAAFEKLATRLHTLILA